MAASNPSRSTGTATSRNERTQPVTQKITTFLWFDNNAEEAAKFYCSVFKNSKILDIVPFGDAGPGPKGSVMLVDFELDGQKFTALNGGPQFKFTEAISLLINCETQQEVDHYWEKLSQGGQEVECGWLKDKYGLAWQVVPTVMFDLMKDPDKEKSDRVMRAMFQMKKFDIEGLKKAAAG